MTLQEKPPSRYAASAPCTATLTAHADAYKAHYMIYMSICFCIIGGCHSSPYEAARMLKLASMQGTNDSWV